MGKSGFKIERAAGGENTLYHDVAEVFRVYRQVTWQMQAKIHQVKARFHREYGTDIDDFLESVYAAGLDVAREEPIPGVTSELIFNKATTPEKVLLKKDGLMDYLENEPVDVLITFGAGNIDRLVEPITRMLEKRLARQ